MNEKSPLYPNALGMAYCSPTLIPIVLFIGKSRRNNGVITLYSLILGRHKMHRISSRWHFNEISVRCRLSNETQRKEPETDTLYRQTSNTTKSLEMSPELC